MSTFASEQRLQVASIHFLGSPPSRFHRLLPATPSPALRGPEREPYAPSRRSKTTRLRGKAPTRRDGGYAAECAPDAPARLRDDGRPHGCDWTYASRRPRSGHGVDAVGHHLLDRRCGVLHKKWLAWRRRFLRKNQSLGEFVELPFFHILRDVHGVARVEELRGEIRGQRRGRVGDAIVVLWTLTWAEGGRGRVRRGSARARFALARRRKRARVRRCKYRKYHGASPPESREISNVETAPASVSRARPAPPVGALAAGMGPARARARDARRSSARASFGVRHATNESTRDERSRRRSSARPRRQDRLETVPCAGLPKMGTMEKARASCAEVANLRKGTLGTYRFARQRQLNALRARGFGDTIVEELTRSRRRRRRPRRPWAPCRASSPPPATRAALRRAAATASAAEMPAAALRRSSTRLDAAALTAAAPAASGGTAGLARTFAIPSSRAPLDPGAPPPASNTRTDAAARDGGGGGVAVAAPTSHPFVLGYDRPPRRIGDELAAPAPPWSPFPPTPAPASSVVAQALGATVKKTTRRSTTTSSRSGRSTVSGTVGGKTARHRRRARRDRFQGVAVGRRRARRRRRQIYAQAEWRFPRASTRWARVASGLEWRRTPRATFAAAAADERTADVVADVDVLAQPRASGDALPTIEAAPMMTSAGRGASASSPAGCARSTERSAGRHRPQDPLPARR